MSTNTRSVEDFVTDFVSSFPQSITEPSWFSDDATIWHNGDQQTVSVSVAAYSIGRLLEGFEDFRSEDVVTDIFGDGFALRFYYAFTSREGAKIRVPVALFGTVRDGLITSLQEYVDAAQCAPMGPAFVEGS